jgi:hypothetical protein
MMPSEVAAAAAAAAAGGGSSIINSTFQAAAATNTVPFNAFHSYRCDASVFALTSFHQPKLQAIPELLNTNAASPDHH